MNNPEDKQLELLFRAENLAKDIKAFLREIIKRKPPKKKGLKPESEEQSNEESK